MTKQALFWAVMTVVFAVLFVLCIAGVVASDNHDGLPGPTIAYAVLGLVVFPLLMVKELRRGQSR